MSNAPVSPSQRHIQINEVNFRVYEWPGDGDPLLFLHATGFHSRCWDQVIKRLPGAHVIAVDMHFHGGTSTEGEIDWSRFPIDVSALVQHMDLNNIIGVGHSMGGCVAARVAAALPNRFKQLVLIDPVIMAERTRDNFPEASTEISPSNHPVAFRKNDWHSSNEMYERFKSKAPFNSWHSDVLRDYCDHALEEEDVHGRYKLACKPVDEAAFYLASIDYSAMKSEIESIATPTTIMRAPPPISGEDIDFSTSPTWPELASNMQNARDVYLPNCNHFIPMQEPELVADYVQQAMTGEWS